MIFKTFQDFCLNESKKLPHNFSCVYGKVPNVLAGKIIKFGKDEIPHKDLYTAEEGCGRDINPHITILYGLHTEDPKEFESFLNHHRDSLHVRLGKISLFKNDNFDVVKIEVISQEFVDMNHKIKRVFDFTSSYPKYIPHLTIAYVKKGKGDHLDGNKKFLNTEFNVKEIVFSSKNRKKTKFELD